MKTIDEIVGLGKKVGMYSALTLSALYSLGGDCGGDDKSKPCYSQEDCSSDEKCEEHCPCGRDCYKACAMKSVPPWERADPLYGKDCADEYNVKGETP